MHLKNHFYLNITIFLYTSLIKIKNKQFKLDGLFFFFLFFIFFKVKQLLKELQQRF